MADITQTISTFPPAPDSATDTPTEFNSKSDAFVNHQASVYVGEVNQWTTEANGLKSDMNQVKAEIDTIVATIPDGAIDDTNISSTNVFSNQKVEADFLKTADADTTYMKEVDADAKYMIEADADAKYITEVYADTKYMVEADADARYMPMGDFEHGGTVENGWVKYPDGTLEVTRFDTILTTTTNKSGIIYYYDHAGLSLVGAEAGNPPAFISPPLCTYGVFPDSTLCWATMGALATTTTTAYVRLLSGATGSKGYVYVIAKGRWK